MSRIVCHFSCGAVSAVATKLAIAQFGAVEIAKFKGKEPFDVWLAWALAPRPWEK